MTRDEIVAYFRRYSNNVTDPAFFQLSGFTKTQIFQYCLDRLHVEDQYRALIGLYPSPLEMKNAKTAPSPEHRAALLQSLYTVGAPTGLTLRAVEGIDRWEVSREWIKAVSRLEKSPSASITSARTLLERVCKSILHDNGASPSDLAEGDLARLVRATRQSLGIDGGEKTITQGVSTLVHGIAEISNAAGDRHADIEQRPIPLATARLTCDTAFALALYFLDVARTSESQDGSALVASRSTASTAERTRARTPRRTRR